MDNQLIEFRAASNYIGGMRKTFSDAFIDHLQQHDVQVTTIAEATGVKKDALYKVKQGKTQNMSVDDAVRVAAYFGETVEEFMGLSEPRLDDALIRRIEGLTPRERGLLQAAIDAFLSPPDPAAPQDDPDAAKAASAQPPKDDPNP